MLSRYGRRKIYTDEKYITKENVRSVIRETVAYHSANVIDMKELYDIERGVQSLSRKKEIRPEIDIKATDSIASQILDFKLGYEHGEPISYTQRANIDSTNPNGNLKEVNADDLRIITLNEMMREVKKASKDNKLARDIKICGLGYRYIYPKQVKRGISPFDIAILNPLNAFIIHENSFSEKPIAGVTFTENIKTLQKTYTVYTEDWIFIFDMNEGNDVYQEANILGMIPIIEYVNNDDITGCFEKALPLIDSLNVVTSDRVNDICQTVQSILWLHNTKLDQEQKEQLVDGGVIQTQANADGKDAKIQYVNAPLNQTQIQTLSDSLKERILEICGVPKLSEASNTTGEAMRVTNGWHTAETQAKTSELTWRASEDDFLEICLEIIRMSTDMPNGVDKLKLSDIDYEMHRSENYDISSRVNSFVTLLNAGCDIQKSAIYCHISDDPIQFALDSKDGIDKKRFPTEENPTEVIDTDIEDKAVESIQPDTVAIQ